MEFCPAWLRRVLVEGFHLHFLFIPYGNDWEEWGRRLTDPRPDTIIASRLWRAVPAVIAGTISYFQTVEIIEKVDKIQKSTRNARA